MERVPRLGDATDCLQRQDWDVALLDLTLPDSAGLDSLDVLVRTAPSLPVVVLTNTNDENLALEAVRRGAQDYLMKRQVNQDLLVRSLRYAIERKQAEVLLQATNEDLERRVRTRTAELQETNWQLRQEIEQRQSIQERLTLAQRAGKIGTFHWHLTTDTVTWSAELEALYGQAPGTFGNGNQAWFDAIHPETCDRIRQELQLAVEQQQGFNSEFQIIHPDGKSHWIAVKSSLFRDGAGRPYLVGIHMDVTEKKQLEEQFLRAQRLEGLGTLASGIAHDLNNILTPILLVVQLLALQHQNFDEATQKKLKILETSAQRGADLVRQILAFARGVEGKRFSLQVGHLLQEIRKLIQQTLPKSIAIKVDIPPSLWPISGDATQLHQVFMNLCVNARDAMPEGGTLTLTAANCTIDESDARQYFEAQPGAYVLVTVMDTGTGISPQVLNRIFDPFFTTKDIGKGTGLGLSAVLGIVKSHGGFIDVESAIGQGSQFKVYLPATETAEMDQEVNLELLSGNQELILVVDDEATIREMARSALETYNYRVLSAADGLDAIATLAEHKQEIYAVLMDLVMPTMDGISALPLMQRLQPGLRIIAMSGLNSPQTVTKTHQLGFQAVLNKPFTTHELLQILQV